MGSKRKRPRMRVQRRSRGEGLSGAHGLLARACDLTADSPERDLMLLAGYIGVARGIRAASRINPLVGSRLPRVQKLAHALLDAMMDGGPELADRLLDEYLDEDSASVH